MDSDLDPRVQVGEDLWALACSVGQEPMAMKLVTPLPSRGGPASSGGRAAFRVEYGDGLRLKARRHRDLETAQRVLALRRFVASRHLPAMVASQGACHLTEWIEGDSPDPDDPKLLATAGALLGRMHQVDMLPEVQGYRFDYRHWGGRIRRNAEQLLEVGALSGAEVEVLLGRLERQAPSHSEPVVIHADLAPDNLVVSSGGELMLVDNENLAVDAPGFDLARTWYRWPMNESRSAAFLSAYREHGDPGPFLGFAEFWTMVVLLEAGHFRVLRDTPDATAPLDRLRALMAGPGA
ncbi:MAG: phosphotransferase [Gemmatimonadetes bacterium]|nr:phosphotransferase [Gemmatimonadota bacterium]NNM03956.1 phosphotransferase [Gemmatimonadota bacterium]